MSQKILEYLNNNGYYFEDNFLDDEIFNQLNTAVIESYKSAINWKTKIKKNHEFYSLPILDQSQFIEISSKLKKFTEENSFNYIYNSLHQDNDVGELIEKIVRLSIRKWEEKGFIFPEKFEKNFSLTCYSSGSFLDWHTDYSRDPKKNYKITILLYFGNERKYEKLECLAFNYFNKITYIEPRPNRALIFIPNKESIHGVAPNTLDTNIGFYERFALSGWLI